MNVSAAMGAVIVVGTRWCDRLIGLISTVVLARLLMPQDFGMIAMASLVIGLIDVLLDVGVNITLVQNKDADDHDYNAAWTLRLIQSVITTLAIVLAAYPAAVYFHDDRVTAVMQVLSLSVLLLGLENIGIVSFQKQMAFGQEFRFFFGRRITGFLATLLSAWYLHSYWALVIGTLVGRLVGVVLSYAMHPMRPRWSFVRMHAMLAFSSWNLLRGIGNYLGENLHRLLVGHRENSTLMGVYTLASDIAALPSGELLAPVNRVLFPMLVVAKDDSHELQRLFLLALGLQALIGVPMGVGLAMLAPELVATMLGDNWQMAVPLVQVMGYINMVAAISASGSYVLLACGKTKMTALHVWGQVMLFVMAAVLMVPEGGAMAIAYIRLAVSVVGFGLFAVLIHLQFPHWRGSEILQSIWRSFAGAGVMALALLALPTLAWPVGGQLLFKTVVGAGVYGLTVVTLWHLTGRCHGAESYCIEKIGFPLKARQR